MDSSSKLGDLAAKVGGSVIGTDQIVVTDVTHDSRQAGAGSLFVAIKGATFDGHDFVEKAVRSGASAVCVSDQQDVAVSQLVVTDTRGVLGELAAEVHGRPSGAIDVIGVTGTNGKTTVTHYIESLLTAAGIRTGLIGTIGNRIDGVQQKSERTTPEASDFQRLLGRMRDQEVEKVAAEVSSHALDLGRVVGTSFKVAAFTNLTQDHLDYHLTMAAYRAAKERLFTDYEVGTAVINTDDEVGAELVVTVRVPVVTIGRSGEFGYTSLHHHATGTDFTLDAPDGNYRISAPVFGDFNVANLVMALACCHASGVGLERLLVHIPGLGVVPGRFEKLEKADGLPDVVVDYAHTPAGITQAIATARQMTVGSVIVVFGAGGDRDRAKRPLMGEAASAADLVVVTSDNPRSEEPEVIVSQVSAGVTAPLMRQVDRRVAISEALSVAGPDDVVLILGKGHEQGQEIGSRVAPFNDREVASAALLRLRKTANSDPTSGSISL